METRAVPCGSKLPLQPEEEPCLQLFLEIPALAAPTQTLKFQPWRTLGLGWNPCFWSAAHTSKHTHLALTGVFKAVSSTTLVFYRAGESKNDIAARALPALEIQNAGFYIFEIPFWDADTTVLVGVQWMDITQIVLSAQWAVQGRYSGETSWEQSNATGTENAIPINSKIVQLSQISHGMVPQSSM